MNERGQGFWDALQKFAFRKPQLSVLSRQVIKGIFDDFQEQQVLFEPRTYLAMAAEGCLSIAYRSLGFEEFCKKMYVELIEVERLIEVFAENLYLQAQEFARRRLGDIFFVKDNIGYQKGLIFSSNFLEQQWLPRIKKAINPLKDENIKVILHSTGNITGFLDQLIDAGFDGIHPVDRSAGMDIAILKKNYAKTLLLFGNVELKDLDSEEIVQQTKKCIKDASYGGGYFISSCSGIDRKLNLKNTLSFFTSAHEYGKNPTNKQPL